MHGWWSRPGGAYDGSSEATSTSIAMNVLVWLALKWIGRLDLFSELRPSV